MKKWFLERWGLLQCVFLCLIALLLIGQWKLSRMLHYFLVNLCVQYQLGTVCFKREILKLRNSLIIQKKVSKSFCKRKILKIKRRFFINHWFFIHCLCFRSIKNFIVKKEISNYWTILKGIIYHLILCVNILTHVLSYNLSCFGACKSLFGIE